MDLIFVLEHMNTTMQLARTRLGWRNVNIVQHKSLKNNQMQPSPEEWRELVNANKLNIELYEYMRELSFDMLRADGLPGVTKEEQDNALVEPSLDNTVPQRS